MTRTLRSPRFRRNGAVWIVALAAALASGTLIGAGSLSAPLGPVEEALAATGLGGPVALR